MSILNLNDEKNCCSTSPAKRDSDKSERCDATEVEICYVVGYKKIYTTIFISILFRFIG